MPTANDHVSQPLPPQMPLHYPLIEPQTGRWQEVAKGVLWGRQAIPFPPGHINIYLLEDTDGWYLIDTGMDYDNSRERLNQLLGAKALNGKPLKGLICTHMHMDHCGLARFVTQNFQVPLWITQLEYLGASTENHGSPTNDTTNQRHYQLCGIDPQVLEVGLSTFEMAMQMCEPIPDRYHCLQQADLLPLQSSRWQVLIGRGHSPEHACLYNAEENLLIAGDQILPEISPNISVGPYNGAANPMGDYLDSLTRFLQLPADTRVLPSHGQVFQGLHVRIEQLQEKLLLGLAQLDDKLDQPMNLPQVVQAAFPRDFHPPQYLLAMGESQAMANYLCHTQRWRCDEDAKGQLMFHRYTQRA